MNQKIAVSVVFVSAMFMKILDATIVNVALPGMAMLLRAFPPHERVRASSILTVPTALAPALGPVLGGLLVTHHSWR